VTDALAPIVRFAHLGACLIPCGASAFALLARPPGAMDLRGWTAAAAIAALTAFGVVVVNVLGGPGEATAGAVAAIAFGVDFGRAWIAHIACALAAAMLAHLNRPRLFAAMTTATVATLAPLGHAAALGSPSAVLVQALHVLAAGFWLGGAVRLARALPSADHATRIRLTRMFAYYGGAAVVALVGAGAWNAWAIAGGLTLLPTTPYTFLLAGKLTLAAGALGLACLNCALAARRDWRLLRIGIAMELGAFAAVIGLVSVLGITPPA